MELFTILDFKKHDGMGIVVARIQGSQTYSYEDLEEYNHDVEESYKMSE